MIEKNLKILSAHQTNFLPWFGYFEKIIKSDVFVFSDDVHFSKQQLTNRIYLSNVENAEFILTLPVERKKGKRLYEKYLANDKKLIEKALKKIISTYSYSYYKAELKEICEKIINLYLQNYSLSEINIYIIKYICQKLDIVNKQFYKGSDLGLQFYSSNERLLKRAEKLNIWNYLYGKGSDNYQDNFFLESAGMKLNKINYNITEELFGSEKKFSIIHQISKFGLNKIRLDLKKYQKVT